MKKIIALFLIVVLLFAVAGCGTSSGGQDGKLKIAFVTDPLGSEKFLLQAYDEFVAMSKEFGYTATLIEANDTNAWTEKTRTAAVQNYDLIVGIGWKAGEPFSALAKEFPNTKFAVIDTVASNPDVKSISYDTANGAYILGVMVGNAFPNETTFGYIGNFQNQSNYEYRYGYMEGVKTVVPNARFIVNFADTFADTSITYNLAKQQAASGAKFIMGSVSSSANEGIYQAALDLASEGKEFYTSGLSIDQTRADNKYIIGGLTKDTAYATRSIIEEFVAGNFTPGNLILGYKEGPFGVVHMNTGDVNFVNTEIITADVLNKTKEASDKVLSGEITIVAPLEK